MRETCKIEANSQPYLGVRGRLLCELCEIFSLSKDRAREIFSNIYPSVPQLKTIRQQCWIFKDTTSKSTMESQTEAVENDPSFRQQLTDTSTRFPTWISLFVLSTVCMFSMVFQRHLWTGAWGWAVAVTIMSMICSFVGYMGYLKARGVFMGQLPELYLVRT